MDKAGNIGSADISIQELKIRYDKLLNDYSALETANKELKDTLMLVNDAERKKTLEALRISNERYAYVTQATSDAIWDWDIVNDHLYWGAGYENIFGHRNNKDSNEIESFNNIHPDDRIAVFDGINRLIQGKDTNWENEYRYIKSNGEYAYVQDKAIVISDDTGKAVRMVGAMQDITERRLSEDAIKKSQEKFNSLVNTIDGIVWEADAVTFDFTYVSHHAEKLLGYPTTQWLTEHGFWANHIHPEDRSWVVDYCIDYTRQKKEHQFEYRMIANDGRIVWLADFVTVIVEMDQPVQLRGVMVDITNRKKAEEALTNERKLLRLLIDNLPDYIYVKDIEARHIINNRANVKLLGFDSEEATTGKTIVDLLGENIAQKFLADDRYVLRSGEAIIDREEPIHNSKNVTHWMLTTKIPLKDAQDNIVGLVGISRDITERKKAVEELREKNSQLKQLSDYLQDIREEERKFLAREVHDELGQLASVIKMDVDWLKIRIPDLQDLYQKRLSHASSVANLMISKVRKIASELRPGMLDELGLIAALESKCKKFTATNGIPCVFESTIEETAIAAHVKTELFRICQESFTNVMRHANATHVSVKLVAKDDTIELCITDDGKGFDTGKKTNTIGLIGMRERCISINGVLTIYSEPGNGTTICAVIPKIK